MTKRYHNPFQHTPRKNIFHFFLWMAGYYNDPFPLPPVPSDFVYPNIQDQVKESDPKMIWINHSTYLVEAFGVHFLMDPVWSEKLSIVGPKRHHAPPFPLSQLPQIDYVIISHNHYDHLDKKTLLQLSSLFKKIIWICPTGVKKWFQKKLGKNEEVIELNWWESHRFIDKEKNVEIQVTAVPSQHFSGRHLFDTDKTLWMGCVVEIFKEKKRKCFYFVGDTGYNSKDFNEIGRKWGDIDLSLIPIGAYSPRGFMGPVHINPYEAVQIHKEVNSKLSVGGHFSTFKLSAEAFNQPPYDLFLALQRENIPWEKFRVLKVGQVLPW